MSVPSLLSIFGNSGGEDKVYVDDVFSNFLYDGNSSTQTINNGIDLSGEGGLTWIKTRGLSYSHSLVDTVRGSTKTLSTNSGDAQYTNSLLSSFNSNGFSLNSSGNVNGADKYASWSFRKAPGFFDVVTFTGNGATSSSPLTVNHSLDSIPGMIWVKNISTNGSNWFVYHRVFGEQKFCLLNTTAAAYAYNGGFTNVTSSSFQVFDSNATNGDLHVAYIFAHDDARFGTDADESIIHCGTFVGSASSFSVNCGFEPQWILMKNTDENNRDWWIFDGMRAQGLRPNSHYDETSNFHSFMIFEPRGFRFISQNGFNIAGKRTIFMAIRRSHKPPEAGTDVYATAQGNSSSSIPAFVSGFPVDFALQNAYNSGPSGNDNFTFSRLTGARTLRTNTNVAEVNGGGLWIADSMVGWSKQYNNTNISQMFKRASGFFDVVTYNGFGTNSGTFSNIPHNLSAAPQMIVVKTRDDVSATGGAGGWHVYHSGVNKEFLYLSTNSSGINPYFITGATSDTFTVRDHPNTGYTGKKYIALLFGTLPGISKVGSYSGSGNAINVDCGFTNGARFILIKRSDGTGDWYYWDSVRGIVSGNDPYLLMNTGDRQVTNTDYVDPINSGFTVTSSAPAALNTSGGTYLFLAIA